MRSITACFCAAATLLLVACDRASTEESATSRTDRYGDPLPPGAVARMGTTRLRHGNTLGAVAFSPNGKILASVDQGSNAIRQPVCLWDVATGRLVSQCDGPMNGSVALFFSADGRNIVSGGMHGPAITSDAESGEEISRFGGERTWQLSLRPDGRVAAIAGQGVSRWDVMTGEEIRSLPFAPGRVGAVAYAPDGKTIAATDSQTGTIHLYDAVTGKELRQFLGLQGIVWPIVYAADGTKLAAVCKGSIETGQGRGEVAVWDAASGKELYRFAEHFDRAAFSPDGTMLAAGGDGGLAVLFDLATGNELRRFVADPIKTIVVAFSPDGKTLAAAGHGRIIHLVDTATGRETHRFDGHDGAIAALALTSDGKRVISCGWDRTAIMWDLQTGAMLRRFADNSAQLRSVADSPDGRVIAGAGRANQTVEPIILWDADTTEELHRLEGHSIGTNLVAFLAGGREILSVGGDLHVRVRETWTGKERLDFSAGQSPAWVAALAPDQRLLATVDRTNEVNIWDLSKGERRQGFQLPERIRTAEGFETTNPMLSMAFSPDGKTLAVRTAHGGVQLREVLTGKERDRFEFPVRQYEGGAVAFSPDGKFLAMGTHDHRIQLWDLATRKETASLVGHRGPVSALLFTADGKTLVSASYDTTLLVWDVARWTVERRPTHHASPRQTPTADFP